MTTADILQKYFRYVVAAGLVIACVCASIIVVETLPPRAISMATGPEGGAYYEMGIQYREILKRAGVELQLRSTAGSSENLALLRDSQSGIDVGFIQGGTTSKKESPTLEVLGTVGYEPLWLFYRSEIGVGIQALRGRRLSIGSEGSGSRTLALELVKRFKLDNFIGELLGFAPYLAAEKLIAGDIDAAFIVTAWDSPIVQRLVTAKGIELAGFPRADAYVALYPFLNKLVLPAGVADLLANRPPVDVTLLAPKATLAVRVNLHPAIQHLLLSAAVQIHSQPGIFQKAGQFPAAESIDLPLSEEAQQFYKAGRPFLQAHLPFWLATLFERVLVVFVPLAALLYPMFKFLPQIYDWIMRSRVIRLYDEIRMIEREVDRKLERHDTGAIVAKLDQLDDRANRLRLPRVYAIMVYTLRAHINFVRGHLVKSPEPKGP